MLKKKSLIFALIGVLMFAVAMYFMYAETRETFDIGEFDDNQEPEPEADPEPEEANSTVSDESNTSS